MFSDPGFAREPITEIVIPSTLDDSLAPSGAHVVRLSWYERLYRRLPAALVLNVTGACRPVLMEGFVKEAGFENVEREFVGGLIPSEIITAVKK